MLFKDFQNELGQLNTLLDEKDKEFQKVSLELEQKTKSIEEKTDDIAELIKEKTKYEAALQELKLYRLFLISTGIGMGLLGAVGICNALVIESVIVMAIFGFATVGIGAIASHKDWQVLKKIVDSSKGIDYKTKIGELEKQVDRDLKDVNQLRDQRQKLTEEKEDLTKRRTYLVGSVTENLLDVYHKDNLDIQVLPYEAGKYKVKTL